MVAANAWMNSPEGVTLDTAGNVVAVDPLGVIFNEAMPLMAAHMVIAAYLVGGFLVAMVYATAMLRGRRDHYHRLGFLIAFTVAAIATPVQMGVGDGLARWVYNNQPVKFAAIEMVPTTSSDVPETLLGHLNSEGEVVGGVPIPGLASWLSDPSTGRATVVQGLDTVPADERPTNRQVNVVHLAWDIMVGVGTAAVPADAVVLGVVDLPTRHASQQVVPALRRRRRPARRRGHGGGVDRERGRPSAVDRLQQDAGGGRRDHQHRESGSPSSPSRSSISGWASPRSSSCAG